MTVESFLSRKPVVTSTDAGGPARVRRGRRERASWPRPSPQALADAIDRLFALPEARLREMGAEARRARRAPVMGHGRGPPDGDPAVRLALWTPRPDAAWVAALVPLLEREVRASRSCAGARARPEASLDLYHVADDSRARLRAPRAAPAARRRAARRVEPARARRAPRPRSGAAPAAYRRRGAPRPRRRPAPSSRGRWSAASAGSCPRCCR